MTNFGVNWVLYTPKLPTYPPFWNEYRGYVALIARFETLPWGSRSREYQYVFKGPEFGVVKGIYIEGYSDP